MPQIGIIGAVSCLNHEVLELINKKGIEVFFYNPVQPVNSVFGKAVPNPFSLIKNSDLLIISRDDESFFGLIVESILSFKPVLLNNLSLFSTEEVDEIIKLSSEASVSVKPLINGEIISIASRVHYLFPHNIRLAQLIIKGQTQLLPSDMDLFSFLLFFKLIFKSNIQRILYEPLGKEESENISFNHITLSSGIASFYYDPVFPLSHFTLDVAGSCQKAYFDFLNEEIWLVSNEIKSKHKFSIEPSNEVMAKQIILPLINNSSLISLDLWDVKELLKFYHPFRKKESLNI